MPDKKRVLIAEDDAGARRALEQLFATSGYDVIVAEDGAAALAAWDDAAADIVVTDLDMPGMRGDELLKALRARNPSLPVIMVTAANEVRTAVDAMKGGAADYLTKPVDFDELLLAVERALENRDVRLENENLRRHVREQTNDGLRGLLGTSPAMQRVYRVAKQVATSRATVLITGESGTGKGELARAIHALSPRAQKPFVSVHCAALAETLLESELFGHEKGSFTGADKRRTGRFEQADGGTLFLDEIGEISASTQVKLLSVLQDRKFERVGGNETVRVDVRVVAATNRDLAKAVAEKTFREDLYYRLNVVHVEMPPLRVRGGDVLVLAEHFLRKYALENHKPITGFSDRARAKIRAHRWPGNVRALENAIERAVVLADAETIDEDLLPFETVASEPPAGLHVPGLTMAEIERWAITKALDAFEGSTVKAAESLDVSVRTIQYRLHQYGLTRERSSSRD